MLYQSYLPAQRIGLRVDRHDSDYTKLYLKRLSVKRILSIKIGRRACI